ncbi:hypothetical protein [Actinocorallia libanotica]|uniref:Uncharacterized protein n=1 Tax=Actinocorallia libanotica TaxID=46162 RepID=A0ABN1QQD8_9ACTN
MSNSDAHETGKQFAEIVLGVKIVDTPPPADSVHGRLLAFKEANPDVEITAEHVAKAKRGEL